MSKPVESRGIGQFERSSASHRSAGGRAKSRENKGRVAHSKGGICRGPRHYHESNRGSCNRYFVRSRRSPASTLARGVLVTPARFLPLERARERETERKVAIGQSTRARSSSALSLRELRRKMENVEEPRRSSFLFVCLLFLFLFFSTKKERDWLSRGLQRR
jgi:hypothetical protein